MARLDPARSPPSGFTRYVDPLPSEPARDGLTVAACGEPPIHGAGHTVTALYELKPVVGAAGALGEVRLLWVDPRTNATRDIEEAISTESLATNFEWTSPRFQLAVVVAQYAEVLRDSVWAERVGSDLHLLSEWAGYLTGALREDPEVADFDDLVRRATAIRSR